MISLADIGFIASLYILSLFIVEALYMNIIIVNNDFYDITPLLAIISKTIYLCQIMYI